MNRAEFDRGGQEGKYFSAEMSGGEAEKLTDMKVCGKKTGGLRVSPTISSLITLNEEGRTVLARPLFNYENNR